MQDEKQGAARGLWPAKYLQAPPGKENGAAKDIASDEIALIILNSPLDDFTYFRRLYDHASFVICADGGANRLYDLVTGTHDDLAFDVALKKALPNLIHGDLDSLTDHVRSSYAKLGVKVTKDPDQYSTDFGKAIKKVIEHRSCVRDILVLGSLGGRVDQGVGLLHELYREQKHRHPNVRFWLFSESSVTVILSPGTTVLHTPLDDRLIKRNIGILPVYGPAVITTKGLEWNVADWRTEMGGQLSTSNHIVEDVIEITTDREVVFTVERAVGR